MRSMVQSIKSKTEKVMSSPIINFISKLAFTASIMIIWNQAFADTADPLAGTSDSLVATLGSNGTGRKFIYLIEGIFAIATYIKTKNVMMFGGVVGIAIFLNILFKVAGVSG